MVSDDCPLPAACTVPWVLMTFCALSASKPLPPMVPLLLFSVPETSSLSSWSPLADSCPPAVVRLPVATVMVRADVLALVRSVFCPVTCSVPLLMILPPVPASVCAVICSCPMPACWRVPSVLSNRVLLSDRSPLPASVPPALLNTLA